MDFLRGCEEHAMDPSPPRAFLAQLVELTVLEGMPLVSLTVSVLIGGEVLVPIQFMGKYFLKCLKI